MIDAKEIMERWSLGILERIYYGLKSCCGASTIEFSFEGRQLYIRRAPEPSDIKWENMGVSLWTLFKNRLVTIFATLVCLVAFFGLLFGIKIAQVRMS